MLLLHIKCGESFTLFCFVLLWSFLSSTEAQSSRREWGWGFFLAPVSHCRAWSCFVDGHLIPHLVDPLLMKGLGLGLDDHQRTLP